MTVLKIIALTLLIMTSVWLIIDAIFIGKSLSYAMKNKIKYEKTLGTETVMLLIWAICLSILVLV